MTARLEVALIGCGAMGANHARVVATAPDTRLALVVDPDERTGRAVAERYGSRWAPRPDDLSGMHAAVVAAPTEHHLPLALDVIAAGLPLLVEKPVCASLAETEQVVSASARAGLPLQCGLLERFNPAVMVALKMIGEPRYARAERHSPYAPRIKTGVAWDLLVHDVDLIVQVFGGTDPTNVDLSVGLFHPSSLPGTQDVVEATMRFGNGGIASASASRIGQRKVRSLCIQGLDVMIEVDLLRRGVTAYRHTVLEGGETGSGFRQATEMEVPEIIGAEPLVTQLAHFVKLVRGQVDADAERASILPAHRIVDEALAAGAR